MVVCEENVHTSVNRFSRKLLFLTYYAYLLSCSSSSVPHLPGTPPRASHFLKGGTYGVWLLGSPTCTHGSRQWELVSHPPYAIWLLLLSIRPVSRERAETEAALVHTSSLRSGLDKCGGRGSWTGSFFTLMQRQHGESQGSVHPHAGNITDIDSDRAAAQTQPLCPNMTSRWMSVPERRQFEFGDTWVSYWGFEAISNWNLIQVSMEVMRRQWQRLVNKTSPWEKMSTT